MHSTKNEQSSAKTREELETKVKPNQIGVAIGFIKNTHKGAVLVKCETEKANERMKQEMIIKMGKEYDIEETKMRKPMVKIVNMDWKPTKELDNNTIIEAVYNQNEFLNIEEDEVNVKLFRETKDKKPYLILECNGSAHRKLLLRGKINLGYKRCHVYDNLYIVRCFKCNGFNHTSQHCKSSSEICSKCSLSHNSKHCNSQEIQCINCKKHNELTKTNLSTDHHSFSTSCTVYQKKLQGIKERTNYS